MAWQARPRARRSTLATGRSPPRLRARLTTRPLSPRAAPGRESAGRGRCGTRSQRQVAARDHEVGFAHPQDVDQLACVLKSAEVRAVVDDVLSERACEAWNDLELVERGTVEVGPDQDGGAGGALRERDFDLLAILQAAGQVGKARDVCFHGQSAGGGDGVVNAIPALHPVKAGVLDRADHVDQEAGRSRDVDVACGCCGGCLRGGRRAGVCAGRCVDVGCDHPADPEQHRKGEGEEGFPAGNQAEVVAHAGEARARAHGGKPSLLRVSRAIGWFRGKDSNLRSRIQSPLPYLLATPESLPGYQWWPSDELCARRALKQYAERSGRPET